MPIPKKQPRCILIAGPNGAGKSTFVRRYLPGEKVVHFVNADLIAGGLSPFKPELARIRAGRLMLDAIDRLATGGKDFGFETTLSGLGYISRIRKLKRLGYRIEIVYLKLRSTRLALKRIAARVREGGHGVPRADVVRRFARGWENFEQVYRPLADLGTVYDNSGREPLPDDDRQVTSERGRRTTLTTAEKVDHALRQAAKDAQRIARMHGVPIYVWEAGRLVALKP